MLRVALTIGTRPELIKLAPVIAQLRARPLDFDVRVIFTAQHRGLLDQMADFFGIQPDVDHDLMRPNQTLSDLTGRLLTALDRTLAELVPDVVLGQGDTTTVLATALACYYRQVPFCHVEAGLRTADIYSPFPEEGNRRMVGQLASLHFAPTADARDRLLAEGVDPDKVLLTGNTVVDALLQTAARDDLPLPAVVADAKRLVLLTMHRRENAGEPRQRVLRAVRILADLFPDVTILFPCHPNPSVREPALAMLQGIRNVHVVEPLDYGELVAVLKRAELVLTDSGGLQEEAPSLNVPLLVLRDETERPEGVASGVAQLVGTEPSRILEAACKILQAPRVELPLPGKNPYGDGHAAARIVRALLEWPARKSVRVAVAA